MKIRVKNIILYGFNILTKKYFQKNIVITNIYVLYSVYLLPTKGDTIITKGPN